MNAAASTATGLMVDGGREVGEKITIVGKVTSTNCRVNC